MGKKIEAATHLMANFFLLFNFLKKRIAKKVRVLDWVRQI
jgi:hypothetical protein